MVKRVLVILSGIILSGLILVLFTGKKLDDAAKVRYGNITKIVFYDGRGGLNKPLTLEDKEKIRQFMDYIDGYRVRKTKNPMKTGWIHSAVFYDNDKEVMKITFGYPLEVNGEYYRVVRGGRSLDTVNIDNFLKSVDASWKISDKK